MIEAKAKPKKNQIIKKIITVIINIVFVLLIVVGILIAITLLPIKGNIKIYSVRTGSMEPSIPVGSMIVAQPQSKYQKEEIVTFLPYNANDKKDTITHRIVDVVESESQVFYSTKGDANDEEDIGLINGNQIKGKVLLKVPALGYVIGYLKTLPGLILIIIIPTTIIVYEEVKKIKKEVAVVINNKRKNREKK